MFTIACTVQSITFHSPIWGGLKIKSGSSWFPQMPPGGQIIIQGASMRKWLAYKCAKFQLPRSISYWDIEWVQK